MIYYEINEFNACLKEQSRLLCLDIGKVRVGCALSDKGKRLSRSYGVFNLKKQKFTSATLSAILDGEEAYGIVVGYPLQMDGTEGSSCAMVDSFIKKYLLKLNQPIFMQDERLSSAAVTRYFNEMEMNRKEQAKVNDQAAASYILQITLDKLMRIA